jgi:hypothetical protein
VLSTSEAQSSDTDDLKSFPPINSWLAFYCTAACYDYDDNCFYSLLLSCFIPTSASARASMPACLDGRASEREHELAFFSFFFPPIPPLSFPTHSSKKSSRIQRQKTNDFNDITQNHHTINHEAKRTRAQHHWHGAERGGYEYGFLFPFSFWAFPCRAFSYFTF